MGNAGVVLFYGAIVYDALSSLLQAIVRIDQPSCLRLFKVETKSFA